MWEPVGPLPASVYWRRRCTAVAVAVLLIGAAIWGAAVLLTLGGAGGAAMAIGQGAGNGMLTVAKGVLPLRLYGSENYAYRSAMLSRPAQFAQIAGPAIYGLVLERSATLALAGSSALCLVMFAMTFGLARARQLSQETVPA